jgi:hypothetical protein
MLTLSGALTCLDARNGQKEYMRISFRSELSIYPLLFSKKLEVLARFPGLSMKLRAVFALMAAEVS